MSDAARVQYADLWGLREGKYSVLRATDFSTAGWQLLQPRPPQYFLVPKDLDLLSEYQGGWSMSDIFTLKSTGIKTHRDHFVTDVDAERLRSRIAEFQDERLSDAELRERFGLRDTRDWRLSEARTRLRAREDWENALTVCAYRPFDLRAIYYSVDLIELARPAAMRHMLFKNLSLVANRQVRTEAVRHFWVASAPSDFHLLETAHASMTVFPLYLYEWHEKEHTVLFSMDPTGRRPNLSAEFTGVVSGKLLLDFIADGKGDLESTFGPEDIFHYMYAVFHSPTYRERYAEFLKIDFPRLPLTSDLGLFRALAEKGEELVALHLMESPELDHGTPKFHGKGSNEAEKLRYAEPGRVYINKTQYFEGVEPEVWGFHIGGYQVLEKWLKDRKGRTLSYDDVTHYGKIVVALKETIRLMQEIDEIIPSWPIE